MFPKIFRLTAARVAGVLAKGRSVHTPHFSIRCRDISPHEHGGVSVIVAKKVARKAHERNRIRRRVYGVLRDIYKTPRALEEKQCIVFAKKDADTLSTTDMRIEIQELFQTAGIR